MRKGEEREEGEEEGKEGGAAGWGRKCGREGAGGVDWDAWYSIMHTTRFHPFFHISSDHRGHQMTVCVAEPKNKQYSHLLCLQGA